LIIACKEGHSQQQQKAKQNRGLFPRSLEAHSRKCANNQPMIHYEAQKLTLIKLVVA